MRNFIKKIYEETKEQTQAKLLISSLVEGFKKIDLYEDEIECYLSTLIYAGYIKGYVIHQQSVILSKTNPFPELKDVNMN